MSNDETGSAKSFGFGPPCWCGHKWSEHGTRLDEAVVCNVGDCLCEDFIEKPKTSNDAGEGEG